jgi:hypothetical protein
VRVAYRTVRREIGVHSAIYHGPVDAPRHRSAALEQADALIVVPVRRSGTLRIVGAFPHSRWNGSAWIDEPCPFEGCPVGIDRIVNALQLAARIGGVRGTILVAKTTQPVTELVSDRVPGDT